MPAPWKWSKNSLDQLATIDARLARWLNHLLMVSPVDFTVMEGHRSPERQAQLFEEGKTELKPGHSKHNAYPSRAVDIAPLIDGKIPWKDKHTWLVFCGFALGVAAEMGLKLRWGGDWDGDFDTAEHGFWDGPHFELVDEEEY